MVIPPVDQSFADSEPRNEIADELRGVFRLISRREPLTHGVERPPDVGILRTNVPVPVELFVVLDLKQSRTRP